MRKHNAMATLLVALLVSACALMPAPESLEQRLVYAKETATAANTLIVALLDTHAIGVAQARAVGGTADAVAAAVDVARLSLDAGDEVEAERQLRSLDRKVAALERFLQHHRNGL